MIQQVANCDSIWANHSLGSLGQRVGALSELTRLGVLGVRFQSSLVQGRRFATHVKVTNVGRLMIILILLIRYHHTLTTTNVTEYLY